MPVICNVENCGQSAVLKRPKTGHAMCKECFFFAFETEIHVTIIKGNLFESGYKVAIGASGGKDSTVLAYILKLLNERYNYGLDLFLLSIDEGITGYRDDSLETVKQNRDDYKLPLKILSYKDLYGWTMDEIVAQIGYKNNCTFCGVFRRQALDRGAAILGADIIVTGHNADDMAETIIMNVLRGDIARLSRCTNIVTEGEGTIPRCKPLKYAYEKEIVMYAHFKELVYFSTECIYSPNAYRGHTREYIKEVERIRPSCILDIIHSGEIITLKESVKFPKRRTCTRCGFVASQEICKACVLLEGLNIGMPKLGIGKSNKAKKIMGLKVNDGSENKTKNKEPRGESKRKIKRENKKKSICEESCISGCRVTVPELPKSIDDIDLSFLTLKPNIHKEKEIYTKMDDNLAPSMLELSSNVKQEFHEVKIKKEKIICKCPPRFRVNNNSRQSQNADDTNSSSDDELFNIDVFASLIGLNIRSTSAETTESPQYLKSQSKKKLKNTDYKLSSSTTELQTSNLQSNHELDYLSKLQSTSTESVHRELQSTDYANSIHEGQSSYSTQVKHQESESIGNVDNKRPLTLEESGHLESQSVNNLNNTEQSSNELPVIVKAKSKRIKPLILPEMMYKTKNNLDF